MDCYHEMMMRNKSWRCGQNQQWSASQDRYYLPVKHSFDDELDRQIAMQPPKVIWTKKSGLPKPEVGR